ncbi:MAG: hypothetical protein ACPGXK_00930 [Phycisphaerae bacterium]
MVDHADKSVGQAAGPTGGASPDKPRKKRWVLKLFILFFVFFLIFVAALPTLLSLKPVSDYAVSIANQSLRGELRLAKLSTGWMGSTVLEGVEVIDPDDRSVVTVKRVAVQSGVIGLPSLLTAFGELELESPEVHLHFDKDNALTLPKAFEPAVDGDDAPPAEGGISLPKGTIKVSNGTVTVSRDGGPSESFAVDGEIDVESLDDLQGLVELKLAGESNLKSEMSITGIGPDGSLENLSGTVTVAMDKPAKLGPLLGIILNQDAMTGETMIQLDGTFAPDDWSADLDIKLTGFESRAQGRSTGTPVDASVAGKMTMTGGQLSGNLNLSGTPGSATTELAYDMSGDGPSPSSEQILSALFGGESIELPAFTLAMNGDIDLAAFDRAMPGLIPLQSGQSLVGGRLAITDLKASGGSAPTVAGRLNLSGFTAEGNGRRTTLSPLTADISAKHVGDTGLVVDRGQITSAPATINATGTMSNLKAEFQSDLDMLKKELGQILDLSSLNMAGKVNGSLTLARSDDTHIGTSLNLTASQFRYGDSERTLDVPQATIVKRGHVLLNNNKLARLVADELQIDVPGQVKALAKGWFDANSNTFDSSARFDQLEFGAVARYLSAFGINVLRGYGGTFTGALAFKRSDGSGPFSCSGELRGKQTTRDGRPLLPDGSVTWANMELQPTGAFTIASARVKAARTDLQVTGFDIGRNRNWYPLGQLKGPADCDEVFGVLSGIYGSPMAEALAGQIVLDAKVGAFSNGMKFTGTGRANPFVYATGQRQISEPLMVTFDAGMDFKNARLVVDRVDISTAPAEIEVKGSVDKYSSDLAMGLNGKYDLNWKELMAFLDRLSPGLKDIVVINGQDSSTFTLSGPFNDLAAKPAFRKAKATASLSWNKASFAGIEVGGTTLSPRLSDGQLILPKTTMAAAQGSVMLVGNLDFRSGSTLLRLPGKNKILDGVTMTPELSRELLSRLNPIFMEVASAQGLVYLTTQDIVLPLDEAGKPQSKGTGRLELTDSKIRADGLMRELLVLSGVARDQGLMTVKIKGLDFYVADGRIHYEDFTLLFPEDYDMKFYGSVGLDSTLDLVVSLPLDRELLNRMGVRGSAAAHTQSILGKRVDVPIVGTRDDPIIDFKNIDLGSILDNALESTVGDSLEGVLDNALDGLFNKKKKKKRD